MKTIHIIGFLFLILFLSNCKSYENFLSYHEYPFIPNEAQLITNYKPLKIQANDILRIRISSTDANAIKPFTIAGASSAGSEGGVANFEEYLVNSNGNIDFPTIGKIEIKGLEIEEAQSRIQEKLAPYFKELPIVQVRLTNFRVNVNGEVSSPGSFQVNNNRLTIVEALTMAGDFTRYSRRDSVLIVREVDGSREFGYVDFNSPDIFSSPYFYLQQNDVVYVRPRKDVINSVKDSSGKVLTWISAGISFFTFIFTVIRLSK
ncbi:MAG: polysaccharide export outer membrane protein [Maribacter sp.]|jgi:polysaccharide export outer membrane protein